MRAFSRSSMSCFGETCGVCDTFEEGYGPPCRSGSTDLKLVLPEALSVSVQYPGWDRHAR
jgi:hypothetical protein